MFTSQMEKYANQTMHALWSQGKCQQSSSSASNFLPASHRRDWAILTQSQILRVFILVDDCKTAKDQRNVEWLLWPWPPTSVPAPAPRPRIPSPLYLEAFNVTSRKTTWAPAPPSPSWNLIMNSLLDSSRMAFKPDVFQVWLGPPGSSCSRVLLSVREEP